MKKKSVKLVAKQFLEATQSLRGYANAVRGAGLSAAHETQALGAGLVKLSAAFEHFALGALVGAINNNPTGTLSRGSGASWPRHISDEACEFIVTGGKEYWDFHGRSGLIEQYKRFLPDNHYLVAIVQDAHYRQALDRLFALRNLEAHESRTSKTKAKQVLGVSYLSSAGAWIKIGDRFDSLCATLDDLAQKARAAAPY